MAYIYNIKICLCVLVILITLYMPRPTNGFNFENQIPKHNLKHKKALSPVIFVPGDGGCQIEGKWSKPRKVLFLCVQEQKSWTTLWLTYMDLAKYAVECFVDNMKLAYDPITRKTSNSPGVQTKVPGFGSPNTIEYIDPNWPYKNYFGTIGKALVQIGYERNKTLRGAPFDFRKAPNELQNYFSDLKQLIEETYSMNNKLKVTLLAHSMGAPILHYFTLQQTQKWKDTYIESIISLAGAWGGSFKTIKVYAMGDNLGNYFLSAKAMRPLQISLSSLSFLMPSRELWSDDEIFIQSPEKNITLGNIKDYFSALNFPNGYEMYKDNKDVLYNKPPPGVEIHCLHGVGVPTTNKLVYKNFSTDFPVNANLMTGDGDGTVNKRSLESCLRWARKQKQPIHHTTYPKVDHMGVLESKTVLQYIVKQLAIVQKRNSNLLKKRSQPNYNSSPNSIYNYLNLNYIPTKKKRKFPNC